MSGSSKHKKKQKRKRVAKSSYESSQPPQAKQQASLASRLKRLRGTADSTPQPPEWSLAMTNTKPFLTPSDGPLFESCKRECYLGFSWQTPDELPPKFHNEFDECFDTLHKEGLFLYDAIQPGNKRLSKTFVTRTVIGNPGSTYRYLGLRLFSHPWSSDDVGEDGSASTSTHVQALIKLGYSPECARALVIVGQLNELLKQSTSSMLEKEVAPYVPIVGSADYSLTLINRMEPTSVKKDLKPDRDYGMGKTSVSWHKDSGLADFSSIAVYHSLRETNGNDESTIPWKVAVRVADKDSETPPLCVPLPSGTIYYLLDDFNHQHEHTVVAGSNQLRYSSTHRVAREGRGTWQYISTKCNQVLSHATCVNDDSSSLSKRQQYLVKQTRAQQALLDEVEFEWLRQWFTQGKVHARLHPYWHSPIQQLQEFFVQLEGKTLATIQLLRESSGKKNKKTTSSPHKDDKQNVALVTVDLFDVLIESMEKRQCTRREWLERLDDPIFGSMSQDERPFESPVLDRDACAFDESRHLPQDFEPLVSNIRKYRKRFVKQKGNTNDSQHSNLTKREKRGIASNWESMKASFAAKKKKK